MNKMFEILGRGVAVVLAFYSVFYLLTVLLGVLLNDPVRLSKEDTTARYFWECRAENSTSFPLMLVIVGRAERNEQCGPLEEKP